ncbi:hypothetical protein HPB48_022880 [Haemaphysalis longicornis]|uniref:Uncharacterized protein n=1 Tax=Haemaphysalis longicornis TaxID=44386 RepID=A0A9J6GUY4_HAELO|nr:hypothetical protein HPB48_022880 [Haemaphysalis longicornis]
MDHFQFKGMVEPAPPRSRRAPEKDDSQAVNLKFGIKFIVGAIVVLSIALLLLRTLSGKRPMEAYCKTTACFRHAELLTATLNRSLDPCSDFQAYVCSAWKPPGSYLDRSRSAMDDVRKSWFPAFHDMLLRGHRILEVARKPLAMYEH